jgi:DNA-binding CsgD family transcriptional regulator
MAISSSIGSTAAAAIAGAREELQIVLGVNGGAQLLARPAGAAVAGAAGRGVRIRVIQEHGARSLPGMAAEVRVTDQAVARMLIADRRSAIVLGDGAHAVAVERSPLVDALAGAFDLAWDAARTAGATERPARLPAGEAATLALLARGLSDEAVALQTHTSTRTVRRRIAALMRELDAQTRFQAGVEAVRRGWL